MDNNNNNNNNNHHNNIINRFIIFCTVLGYKTCDIIVHIVKAIHKVINHKLFVKLFKFGVGVFKKIFSKIWRGIKYVGGAIAFPFKAVYRGFNLFGRTIKSTKGLSIPKRVGKLIKVFFKGLWNNRIIFQTVVNYSLPILAIYYCVNVVAQGTQTEFVVSVDYNGQNIGYVTDEIVVDTAKDMVQDRMIYLDDSETVDIIPTYSIIQKTADNADKILTEYQLADELITLSSDDMVQADGLYINGKFYGAIKDIGAIDKTLDDMMSIYTDDKDNANAEISFTKDIDVVTGLYVTPNIVDTQKTLDMLTGEVQGTVYHIVEGDDTLSGIADEYDLTTKEIMALNPDVEPTRMHDGDEILVSQQIKFLSVKMKKEITYKETVEFETKVTKSNEYDVGVEKTTQEGKDGENKITAEVTYLDGVELSKEITKKEVVSKPVTEEIVKGTGSPTGGTSTGNGSSSGFVWPMNGYVSSGYEYRWGSFHTGIDVARYGGAYGASLYAVAGGVVVAASSTTGGYGKLIKIDHGNGLQTWYAHASMILVSVGEYVSQGQKIGEAGDTGYVTGPHLHFEVRVNGIHKNPYNYLP